MIDIHSHVLHSLDDGARSLEDSLAMLRMAAECGTTDLVATPHANLSYKFDPPLIRERLRELASRTELRLYSGCDFHLSYDNIADAIDHPRKYTLNQKTYLLVEFSDLLIFRNTDEIFARLQDAGMIPVITHPERNGLLRQRIDQIEGWVNNGAFVQVTANSLTGDFGKRALEFSRVLLDRSLVHFVASDAHDCLDRPPRLDLARAWLTKNYGEVVAEVLLVTNPRSALTGDRVDPVIPETPIGSRKWYQIWR